VALKDAESLKLWMLRQFGAPLVEVELTAEHLDDCIENASRWFVAKKGLHLQAAMDVVPNKVEYDLLPEMDKVLDVAFPSNPLDFSLVFAPFTLPDQQVPYSVFAASGSLGLYSHFTQALQYVTTAKRILGVEVDWRQEHRKLFLFPAKLPTGKVILTYKSSNFTLEQLAERDHDLVKRRAMAEAKKILGRVRSKFDNYPTAQGSVALDGSVLLEEAGAEIERLDEEIFDAGYPMAFLRG